MLQAVGKENQRLLIVLKHVPCQAPLKRKGLPRVFGSLLCWVMYVFLDNFIRKAKNLICNSLSSCGAHITYIELDLHAT